MEMTPFQLAIYTATAAAAPGVKVIWSKQTRERPARPFIELETIDDISLNDQPEESQEDNPDSTSYADELLLHYKEHVETTVQFRVFTSAVTGNGKALAVAKRVRGFFGRAQTQQDLDPITVITRERVQDASFVLDTEYEGRAVMNMRFRSTDIDTDTAGTITSLEVQTILDEAAASLAGVPFSFASMPDFATLIETIVIPPDISPDSIQSTLVIGVPEVTSP